MTDTTHRDPVIESVRAKLLARSIAGFQKYGCGLDRTDLSRIDWLHHAQEEALDLAGYLEVLIRGEEANVQAQGQPKAVPLERHVGRDED
jgi:hypothetical protein